MSRRNQHKKSNSHRCRHEIKRDKLTEEKTIKIINNVNNVKKDMLEEPSLWVRPEFQKLRYFVDIASNNPSKCPKNYNASTSWHIKILTNYCSMHIFCRK